MTIRMFARLVLALCLLLATQASAQTVTSTVTVRPDGNDSTYSKGFAIRAVNGEGRGLTRSISGRLIEFRLSDGAVTQSWALPSTGFSICLLYTSPSPRD